MGNVTATLVYPDFQTSGGETRYPGAIKAKFATITLSASYATGGDSIDSVALTALGFQKVYGVTPIGYALKTWWVYYDSVALKFVAVVLGTGAEVANTTNLTTLVAQCIVYGV